MSINEIIAPVVEQLRSDVSSGVSKPTVRSGADVAQGNNSVKPSPSDKNGVTVKRVDERPSREAVEKALVKANELAKSLSRKLNFSYDNRIDKVVVKVMESNTEKVVRQIPPEEMIRLSMKMDDLLGMLINQDV